MSEQDAIHTRLGISRETWIAYRAISTDDTLYQDSQLIIKAGPTEQVAAAALGSWIEEQDAIIGELGLLAQLLPATLADVDWEAVVQGFTPDDPCSAEAILARDAYGLTSEILAVGVPDRSHSPPVTGSPRNA